MNIVFGACTHLKVQDRLLAEYVYSNQASVVTAPTALFGNECTFKIKINAFMPSRATWNEAG
jgi:hypothetical protein